MKHAAFYLMACAYLTGQILFALPLPFPAKTSLLCMFSVFYTWSLDTLEERKLLEEIK